LVTVTLAPALALAFALAIATGREVWRRQRSRALRQRRSPLLLLHHSCHEGHHPTEVRVGGLMPFVSLLKTSRIMAAAAARARKATSRSGMGVEGVNAVNIFMIFIVSSQ